MRQAGIVVEAADDLLHFSIEGGQAYRAGESLRKWRLSVERWRS